MNSTFNARFQLKRDLKAEWDKNDPVLLNGEMVIVDMPDGTHKTKTGDGTKRYSELPFDGVVEYSKHVSAMLRADAWTGSSQRVAVPGLLASGNGIVSIPEAATAEQHLVAVLACLHLLITALM